MQKLPGSKIIFTNGSKKHAETTILKLGIKDKAVFIEHAKGYLNLGDVSIIIAVACKHRDQAYVLSRYIIEEIKKRSPIWKKEHYENEESEWLKGNPVAYEKI